MSLTINSIFNNINNNPTQNKNTQNKKFNLEFDDKKLSSEEDEKLYEFYKKDEFAKLNCTSFEDFKKSLLTFPPLTAPGIVRKTWREQWDKSTTTEKDAMFSVFEYYNILMDGFSIDGLKTEVPKDINGYLKLMSRIKDYSCAAIRINSPTSTECFEIDNVINKFTTELKKYV